MTIMTIDGVLGMEMLMCLFRLLHIFHICSYFGCLLRLRPFQFQFFFVVVAVVFVSILFFNLYVFLWCNNLLDFFRLMASTCLANDAQHIASQTNVCLQVLTRQPIYLRF